jgi:hypothetical protein
MLGETGEMGATGHSYPRIDFEHRVLKMFWKVLPSKAVMYKQPCQRKSSFVQLPVIVFCDIKQNKSKFNSGGS